MFPRKEKNNSDNFNVNDLDDANEFANMNSQQQGVVKSGTARPQTIMTTTMTQAIPPVNSTINNTTTPNINRENRISTGHMVETLDTNQKKRRVDGFLEDTTGSITTQKKQNTNNDMRLIPIQSIFASIGETAASNNSFANRNQMPMQMPMPIPMPMPMQQIFPVTPNNNTMISSTNNSFTQMDQIAEPTDTAIMRVFHDQNAYTKVIRFLERLTELAKTKSYRLAKSLSDQLEQAKNFHPDKTVTVDQHGFPTIGNDITFRTYCKKINFTNTLIHNFKLFGFDMIKLDPPPKGFREGVIEIFIDLAQLMTTAKHCGLDGLADSYQRKIKAIATISSAENPYVNANFEADNFGEKISAKTRAEHVEFKYFYTVYPKSSFQKDFVAHENKKIEGRLEAPLPNIVNSGASRTQTTTSIMTQSTPTIIPMVNTTSRKNTPTMNNDMRLIPIQSIFASIEETASSNNCFDHRNQMPMPMQQTFPVISPMVSDETSTKTAYSSTNNLFSPIEKNNVDIDLATDPIIREFHKLEIYTQFMHFLERLTKIATLNADPLAKSLSDTLEQAKKCHPAINVSIDQCGLPVFGEGNISFLNYCMTINFGNLLAINNQLIGFDMYKVNSQKRGIKEIVLDLALLKATAKHWNLDELADFYQRKFDAIAPLSVEKNLYIIADITADDFGEKVSVQTDKYYMTFKYFYNVYPEKLQNDFVAHENKKIEGFVAKKLLQL